MTPAKTETALLGGYCSGAYPMTNSPVDALTTTSVVSFTQSPVDGTH